MAESKGMRRRAAASMAAILLLLAMLVLTTCALFFSLVSVEDNLFQTGTVQIDLNGGRPIFDGADNVEPGHSLVRDFTVENTGSADVYVRLYLDNVAGFLQDSLEFSVYDGETLLFSGGAGDMTRETPCLSDTPLAAGEIRTLTAVVTMREEAGNAYQGGDITFDMTADAVQTRNNPDKAFE